MSTSKMVFMLSIFLTTFNASAYTAFSGYGYCKTWNKFIENDKKEAVTSGLWSSTLTAWLAGLATGVNFATGEDNFPNIDIDTMKEYIVIYCQKNPEGTAYTAVGEIVQKLKK